MSPELDAKLCEKYPKIFRDRHAPMTQTCMCWGFDIGDGWYNLLNGACALVQHHIDEDRKQRLSALQYNRALYWALERNNTTALTKFFTFGEVGGEWAKKQVELELAKATYRAVPEVSSQLIATQIKEKFGTLRFYYFGGDEYCEGVIDLAAYMSGCTCEECGKPGKSTNGGWIKVRCSDCLKDEEYGSETL